jgi:hypothetical protein
VSKVRLTTKVIKGILALAKPGVAHVVNFPMSRKEMTKRKISYRDVEDARIAVQWAESVWANRKANKLEAKPKPPSYDMPVFEDVD